MVKLEDPTLPYADVIPRLRRERTADAVEVFRLGAPGYDWRATYREPGTRVVIAASNAALSSAEADDTIKAIGTVGGLLADLGFQVYAARAMTGGDLEPALLIWVGGSATSTEERDDLRRVALPGVSVALYPVGAPGWRHIDVDDVADWRSFAKRFVADVASLVDVPEKAFLSNNLSNEPRQTDPDDVGQAIVDTVADLHKHGRTRMKQDRRNQDSSGS